MQKLAILIAGFMFLAGCASNDTAHVDTMDDAAVGASASSTTSSGTRIYDYTPGTSSSASSTDSSVSGSVGTFGSGTVSGSGSASDTYNTYNTQT